MASVTRNEKSAGDTAVDGLVAGLAAGVAMAIFLALAGLLTGQPPLAVAGYFDPVASGDGLTRVLAHLAVAAIYGVVFALLLRVLGQWRPSWRRPVWLWGGLFGLALWGAARVVTAPEGPSAVAAVSVWPFAAGHLVYGVVLGYWLGRNGEN